MIRSGGIKGVGGFWYTKKLYRIPKSVCREMVEEIKRERKGGQLGFISFSTSQRE